MESIGTAGSAAESAGAAAESAIVSELTDADGPGPVESSAAATSPSAAYETRHVADEAPT